MFLDISNFVLLKIKLKNRFTKIILKKLIGPIVKEFFNEE